MDWNGTGSLVTVTVLASFHTKITLRIQNRVGDYMQPLQHLLTETKSREIQRTDLEKIVIIRTHPQLF